jgi:hypothetical protein
MCFFKSSKFSELTNVFFYGIGVAPGGRVQSQCLSGHLNNKIRLIGALIPTPGLLLLSWSSCNMINKFFGNSPSTRRPVIFSDYYCCALFVS